MASGKRNRALADFSYRWHRRIGVCAAAPLLIVALTGILLNHPQRLGLDSIHVTRAGILDWYGFTPQSAPVALHQENHWLVLIDDSLFLDGQLLDDAATVPVGFISLGSVAVIATRRSLYLFDGISQQLIERIGSEALPDGSIRALGIDEGRLQLDTSAGAFSAPIDASSFRAEQRSALPIAQTTSELPNDVRAKALAAWRSDKLSLEKVVRDIHTGALFGSVGVVLVDVAAIAMLLLMLSGLYTWSKRR